MQYEGLYFARIDYQDYERRRNDKELEFMWGNNLAGVFTGVIQDHYGAPNGFSFGRDNIVDDPALKTFNVCAKIQAFVDMCKERSKWQRGKHIFLPMGEDFAYDNARRWFKNMDKLQVPLHVISIKILQILIERFSTTPIVAGVTFMSCIPT